MREMYVNNDYTSYHRPDGKTWFWIIILLFMIATIGIVWSSYRSFNQCEFTGCQLPATTRMKSPTTGEVRFYCDEHSAFKAGHNWTIEGPATK